MRNFNYYVQQMSKTHDDAAEIEEQHLKQDDKRREGRRDREGVWVEEVIAVKEEPVSGCMNLLKAYKMQSIFSGITYKSGRKTQAVTASLSLSLPLSHYLFLSLTHTLCGVAGTSAGNWRTRHSTNSVASLLYLKDDAIVSSLAGVAKLQETEVNAFNQRLLLHFFSSPDLFVYVCVCVCVCKYTLWCRS